VKDRKVQTEAQLQRREAALAQEMDWIVLMEFCNLWNLIYFFILIFKVAKMASLVGINS
jgi:hypothetical protein